jgi:hypothetical protein
VLEEKLDKIDQSERSLLFLGKSRLDTNADRLSTLTEIESSLANYGNYLNCCVNKV